MAKEGSQNRPLAEEDLKDLMARGQQKGFLTYEEMNEFLPDDMVNPEFIDELLLMLDKKGIELIDERELVEGKEDQEEAFEDEETSREATVPLKDRRPNKRDSKFIENLGFVGEFGCEVIRKTDIGGSTQDEQGRNEKVMAWGLHPNIISILRDGTDNVGNYFFDTPKL